ncbi:UNVERIFIED_CONTAM: hypothetical protein Sindi_2762200 [Sesamum indicum]
MARTQLVVVMIRVLLVSQRELCCAEIIVTWEMERDNTWVMMVAERLMLEEIRVCLQFYSLALIREKIGRLQVWRLVEVQPVVLAGLGLSRLRIRRFKLNLGNQQQPCNVFLGLGLLLESEFHEQLIILLTTSGETHPSSECKTWKFLSYNVWFREDLEMHKRMKALGDLIESHSPDVMCFQEVTPSFYGIFQKSSWWKRYCCSIPDETAFPGAYFCMQLSKLPVKSYSCKPFHNSIMGRELCVAEVEVQPGITMVIATSHLESPCPAPPTWDQMFSKERVAQATEAVRFLEKNQNVIFCGDMNWDDKLDGPFPLLDGWVDAWTELRPGEVGWTYDTKSNKMLSGNRTLQKRLDRFVCKLKDFKISEIEMIGKDAIPGVSYIKERRVKGQVKELVLPVLPSDHYGMLLTICPSDST